MKAIDRFDTKAKRNVKLSTKFLVLLAFSVLLCSFGVGNIFTLQFNNNYKQIINDDLDHYAEGTVNFLDGRIEDLGRFTDLVCYDQQIINYLAGSDVASLREYVKNISRTMGLDVFAIVDNDGNVIDGGGYNIRIASNLSNNKAVRSALNGKAGYCYDVIGNDSIFSLIQASPFTDGKKNYGCILAAWGIISGEFTDTIIRGYNVDMSIILGRKTIFSAVDARNTRFLVGAEVADEGILKIMDDAMASGKVQSAFLDMGLDNFFMRFIPLVSGDGVAEGVISIGKPHGIINDISIRTWNFVTPIIVGIILVMIVFLFLFIKKWFAKRLRNVVNFLKDMSDGEGDLTKRLELYKRDEIGDVIIYFDLFCDKLQNIVKEIKNGEGSLKEAGEDLSASTDDTASAITQIISNIGSVNEQIKNQTESVSQTSDALHEITGTINNLEGLIEEQSSSVTQASAAVEEMMGNIASVNTSVDKMVNSFGSLSDNAKTGFMKQQDVNEKITQIENQSEMLLEANLAISSIAEQTNLLAMNAAIEAAHAGEAGKGFSVVADEIRKLSETSGAQSKTIGEQLNFIKDSITQVVSASNESSKALEAVSDKIRETDQIVIQIKAAMEEQNEGSRQIGDALRNMNNSTSEVRNTSKAMYSQNEGMVSEMEKLLGNTQLMEQSMNDMSAGATKIHETGDALSGISAKVYESIENISREINKFKV